MKKGIVCSSGRLNGAYCGWRNFSVSPVSSRTLFSVVTTRGAEGHAWSPRRRKQRVFRSAGRHAMPGKRSPTCTKLECHHASSRTVTPAPEIKRLAKIYSSRQPVRASTYSKSNNYTYTIRYDPRFVSIRTMDPTHGWRSRERTKRV